MRRAPAGQRNMACTVAMPSAAERTSSTTAPAAGSVSGALSTAQQIGNSVGVAVTGVLFFGALDHGYGLAFERSVLQMGALLLLVAALTRLMPARQRTA